MREVRNIEYEDRLAELKIPKLIDKRIRDDMILTYRKLSSEEEIDHETFFTLEKIRYNLRDHSRNIFKTRAHLNIRRNFFSWRVVDKWNSLTDHEVTAPSTASFKARYDKQEAIRQSRRPY